MFKKYANTIENICVAVVTLIIINFLIIQPMANRYEKNQDKQMAIMVELAKIEKYKIENDFEKMRTKKGGQIVIDLENTLNALELDSIPVDTTDVEEKGFFGRIFGKSK